MKKLFLLTTLILMTSCASITSYGDNHNTNINTKENVETEGVLETLSDYGNKITIKKHDLINLPLPTFYRRLDFILNRYKIMWFDVTSLDTLMKLKEMIAGYDGKYKDRIAIRYMGDEWFGYKNMNNDEVIAELEASNDTYFQRFHSYNYIENENKIYNKIVLYNENNPVLYAGSTHLKYELYKFRIIVEEN